MEKEVERLLERYDTSLPESLVYEFSNKEYHEGVNTLFCSSPIFDIKLNSVGLEVTNKINSEKFSYYSFTDHNGTFRPKVIFNDKEYNPLIESAIITDNKIMNTLSSLEHIIGDCNIDKLHDCSRTISLAKNFLEGRNPYGIPLYSTP